MTSLHPTVVRFCVDGLGSIRDRYCAISRNWYRRNRERARNGQRKYYQLNREASKKRTSAWTAQNLERRRAMSRASAKRNRSRKRRYDSFYYSRADRRVTRSLRARFRAVLRNQKASDSVVALLGCSPGHLRQHLESRFQPGMTWENYGRYGWHVDHIIPCSAFDLTNPEEVRKCFHFSNLQPLWWRDNIIKGGAPRMKKALA